MMVVVILCI